jgi:hypothetical protein
MIWFTCPKCGKTHGRPENSIGTMVFCDCGQGNLVPWESTAAEPAPQAPLPSAELPPLPKLAPLTFDISSPAATPPPVDEASRRRRAEKRDPNFCLNHQGVPKATTCEDCTESFCAACTVTFEGATLCGPCKNFRVRGLEMTPRNSTAATLSALIALVTGGALAFCLLPLAGGPSAIVFSLLAMLPQVVALGLGIRALYLAQKEGRRGSQAWAITGVTAAALCVVLTVMLNVYAIRAG